VYRNSSPLDGVTITSSRSDNASADSKLPLVLRRRRRATVMWHVPRKTSPSWLIIKSCLSREVSNFLSRTNQHEMLVKRPKGRGKKDDGVVILLDDAFLLRTPSFRI
jgi:hypothetical protein